MAGRDIVVTDQGSVIFQEEDANGVGQAKLQAADNITTDYTIKLPSAATGSGSKQVQVDISSNVATLSFADVSNTGMAGRNVLGGSIEGDDTAADTNDSTASIRDTINAAETSGAGNGNERVIFPAGGYKIKELGKVGTHDCFQAEQGDPATQNSYWLEGAGAGHTTLFNVHDNTTTMIEHVVPASGTLSKIFVLKDMTIDGNDRTTTTAMVNLKADYIFIDNVEFRNMGQALRFPGPGAPKILAITNCRFVDMKPDIGVTAADALITVDETSDDHLFIFTNNYVEGGTPTADGAGQCGLNINGGVGAKSVRSLIRGNHFKELGNEDFGAIWMNNASDSIVADNVFESMIGTAISIKDSSNVRVASNKIVSTSAKWLNTASIQGIRVECATGVDTGIQITGNTIVATTDKEFSEGIKVEGDADGDTTYIEDLIVSDNLIDKSLVSMQVAGLRGNVSITGNTCKNSGNVTPSFAALHIGNLNGDTHVNVEKNAFIGGVKSGRAIFMDRNTADTDTAGEVHFVLKDNFVDGMGHTDHEGFVLGTVGDLAMIYINGHDTSDVLHTFHASGNKYEFTNSESGCYGLMVDNVKGQCTFDSVYEFGAVGDGVADDTVALNRAGLAAGAGGTVYVPPGTYKVTDSGLMLDDSTARDSGASSHAIEILFSGQTWHGEGTIKQTSTTLHILNCLALKTNVRGLAFEQAAAATNGTAIFTSSAGEDEVVDCRFKGLGTNGVEIKGPKTLVKDCLFEDCLGSNISAVAAGTDAVVSNNRITNTAATGTDNGIKGVFVRGIITGNNIKNLGATGIQLSPGSHQARVSNNTIDTWTTYAIECSGASSHVSIVGNTINAATTVVVDTAIVLNAVTDAMVSDNIISSDLRKIYITGDASHVSISNNVMNMLGSPTVDCIEVDAASTTVGLSITNNNIRCATTKSTLAAIDLGSAEDSIVNGNLIRNFNLGIIVGTDKTGNMLTSNRMIGNTTDLTDGGDGTLTSYTTSVIAEFGGNLRYGNSTNANAYSGSGAVDAPLIVYNSSDAGAVVAAAAAGIHTDTINITDSFHYVKATVSTAYLRKILINGLETRAASVFGGNDEQALATAIYDGMILTLANAPGLNWEVRGCDDELIGTLSDETVSDRSGANIVWPGTFFDMSPGLLGRSCTFRFEHDGTQGVWRGISAMFTDGAHT